MSQETSHWGEHELGKREKDPSSLRTLIDAELPETRIFVDRIYQEFTASGRRIQTAQFIRNKGASPWFLVADDGDD